MPVPVLSQSGLPIHELPPVDADLFARAKEAVAAVRGQARRRQGGRFGAANTARMSSGLHSKLLLEQPDVATWHREQVAAITEDLGGDAELSALQRGLVRETARIEVILASLGEQLFVGGVLTPKGKMRAASTLYLQVLDRYGRLAQQLGLGRRARQVTSFQEAVRGR